MGPDAPSRCTALARCWRGSCYGLGFATSTIFLFVMMWLLWCYVGLVSIPPIELQRRALVDFSATTAKPNQTVNVTSQANNKDSRHQPGPLRGNSRGEASIVKTDPVISMSPADRAKGDFNARDKVAATSNYSTADTSSTKEGQNDDPSKRYERGSPSMGSILVRAVSSSAPDNRPEPSDEDRRSQNTPAIPEREKTSSREFDVEVAKRPADSRPEYDDENRRARHPVDDDEDGRPERRRDRDERDPRTEKSDSRRTDEDRRDYDRDRDYPSDRRRHYDRDDRDYDRSTSSRRENDDFRPRERVRGSRRPDDDDYDRPVPARDDRLRDRSDDDRRSSSDRDRDLRSRSDERDYRYSSEDGSRRDRYDSSSRSRPSDDDDYRRDRYDDDDDRYRRRNNRDEDSYRERPAIRDPDETKRTSDTGSVRDPVNSRVRDGERISARDDIREVLPPRRRGDEDKVRDTDDDRIRRPSSTRYAEDSRRPLPDAEVPRDTIRSKDDSSDRRSRYDSDSSSRRIADDRDTGRFRDRSSEDDRSRETPSRTDERDSESRLRKGDDRGLDVPVSIREDKELSNTRSFRTSTDDVSLKTRSYSSADDDDRRYRPRSDRDYDQAPRRRVSDDDYRDDRRSRTDSVRGRDYDRSDDRRDYRDDVRSDRVKESSRDVYDDRRDGSSRSSSSNTRASRPDDDGYRSRDSSYGRETETRSGDYPPNIREKRFQEDLPCSSDRNAEGDRSRCRDDKASVTEQQDRAGRPLTPKEVIEAAYRHRDDSSAPDKATYPVFDPRVNNNMTSPEVIRPNERRGTTIISKKK